MTIRDVSLRFLRCTGSLDVTELRDILHRDAVAEFPFAPAFTPSLLHGRSAIIAAVKRTSEIFETLTKIPNDLHECPERSTLIVTYTCYGLGRAGDYYNGRHTAILQVHGGVVARWREYYDPRALHLLARHNASPPSEADE